MKTQTQDVMHIEEILQKRAEVLARPFTEKNVQAIEFEVVLFSLDKQKYGLETSYIREVYPLKNLTPLPGVPACIRGLANVRRRIYSVIDLNLLFKDTPTTISSQTHLIILQEGTNSFAILIEDIIGIRKITSDEKMLTESALKTNERSLFIKALTHDYVGIIDARKLIENKNLIFSQE